MFPLWTRCAVANFISIQCSDVPRWKYHQSMRSTQIVMNLFIRLDNWCTINSIGKNRQTVTGRRGHIVQTFTPFIDDPFKFHKRSCHVIRANLRRGYQHNFDNKAHRWLPKCTSIFTQQRSLFKRHWDCLFDWLTGKRCVKRHILSQYRYADKYRVRRVVVDWKQIEQKPCKWTLKSIHSPRRSIIISWKW